ncbi:hypothetical protein [Arthrobacter castelli]|uniref:hypothetical protein n=1 Tax=Arthrobacter castelli TaxID=271431 RepID=UPI00047DBDD6|nr:hypothetical protein [Arthrobacter castelli]
MTGAITAIVRVARRILLLATSMIASAIICMVLFAAGLAVSATLGRDIVIPGLVSAVPGAWPELASGTAMFPGVFVWLFGIAALLYFITLHADKKRHATAHGHHQ